MCNKYDFNIFELLIIDNDKKINLDISDYLYYF